MKHAYVDVPVNPVYSSLGCTFRVIVGRPEASGADCKFDAHKTVSEVLIAFSVLMHRLVNALLPLLCHLENEALLIACDNKPLGLLNHEGV